MYEIYYRTGGHGGPYQSITKAIRAARIRLTDTDTFINIVDKSADKVVARVDRDGGATIFPSAWKKDYLR